MADYIKLEIVTPEKAVVSENVKTVIAPGSCGEFGILPGHTTFLTTLNIGALRYVDKNGTERKIFINGGFAEALPDKVTVLAESSERRRDIDVERARRAMERAEKRLGEDDAQKKDIDVIRAKAAMARAMHRLRIVESINH
ncbi:MAG: F0F1 ATP synthase subunit epsilon [Proteobacteria bacterium]|nr:F0F1 ATP synthase subunit epsilon [Pseudomonadota bacterium]